MAKQTATKAEKVYDLTDDSQCTIEDETPCRMKVALGFAADTMGFTELDDIQFPTPKLQQIYVEGRATRSQMVAALEEWAPSLPEDRRQQGNDLVEIVKKEVGQHG